MISFSDTIRLLSRRNIGDLLRRIYIVTELFLYFLSTSVREEAAVNSVKCQ